MLKSIATATMATALLLAPVAHADQTISAAAICDQMTPGWVPMMAPLQPLAICAPAGTFLPGFMGTIHPINQYMGQKFQGSYPVNGADPFSDWIIPAGAQPAGPAPYGWTQSNDGYIQHWCPPECLH